MRRLDEYKLTVYGDSISKGVGFENGRFEPIKNSAVKIIENRYKVKIENNSRIGQTLKRIYEKGYINSYINSLDGKKKNCVIFSIGGNDSDFDWQSVALSPKEEHFSKTPILEFSAMLDELVKILKKNGVKVVFTTLTPVDSERYFAEVISKKADGEKVLDFFNGDITNINRQQECFNMEVVKCAVKNDCRLLDTRTGFLMRTDYLNLFCRDGIHPNVLGQENIARDLINQIEA